MKPLKERALINSATSEYGLADAVQKCHIRVEPDLRGKPTVMKGSWVPSVWSRSWSGKQSDECRHSEFRLVRLFSLTKVRERVCICWFFSLKRTSRADFMPKCVQCSLGEGRMR